MVGAFVIAQGPANPAWADAPAQAETPLAEINRSVQLADTPDEEAHIACRHEPNRRCIADLALAAAEKIESAKGRGWALTRVAEAYAGSGSIEPILAALGHLKESSQRELWLVHVAFVFAEAGDIEAALTTAGRIDDLSKRADALMRVAATAETTDVAAARRGFRLALVTAERIQVAQTRVTEFAEIARMAAVAGDLGIAREAVDAALVQTGTAASVFTMASIAAAQAALGDTAAAHVTVRAIDSPVFHVHAMAGMAEAQAAVGRIESARDTIDAAFKIAEKIERNASDHVPFQFGCESHISNRDSALQEIAGAQAQMGEIEATVATSDKVEDAYVRARILARLAKAPAVMEEVERLREALRAASVALTELGSDQCRDPELASIVAAQAQAGDLDAALKTMAAIEMPDARIRAMVDMAEVAATLDEVATIEKIGSAPVRAMTWANMATTRAAAGNAGAGRRAIMSALEASRLIDDPELLVPTLAKIAEAQMRLGDVEAVRRTVGQLLATTKEFSAAERRTMELRAIAGAQAYAGDFLAALATVEEIEEARHRAEALLEIANALPE